MKSTKKTQSPQVRFTLALNATWSVLRDPVLTKMYARHWKRYITRATKEKLRLIYIQYLTLLISHMLIIRSLSPMFDFFKFLEQYFSKSKNGDLEIVLHNTYRFGINSERHNNR